MKFFLQMIPPTTTAQEKKVNFKTKKIYAADKVVAAKEKYRAYLAGYRPKAPLTGPLRLSVCWQFPKGNRQEGYCANKPDLDNAIKLLQDVMQGLDFFEDDKQICRLELAKIWTDHPGVYIELDELVG